MNREEKIAGIEARLQGARWEEVGQRIGMAGGTLVPVWLERAEQAPGVRAFLREARGDMAWLLAQLRGAAHDSAGTPSDKSPPPPPASAGSRCEAFLVPECRCQSCAELRADATAEREAGVHRAAVTARAPF